MLVVHSLGGLVAKKAFLVSGEVYKDSLQLLYDNTVRIVFLDIPYYGGNFISFALNVITVLKIGRKRVNDNLL
jgi:hypothetical protein